MFGNSGIFVTPRMTRINHRAALSQLKAFEAQVFEAYKEGKAPAALAQPNSDPQQLIGFGENRSRNAFMVPGG